VEGERVSTDTTADAEYNKARQALRERFERLERDALATTRSGAG